MAKCVSFKTLKQPKLLATRITEQPFTKREEAQLTKGLKVYSRTKDGEAIYLWTEGAEKAERKRVVIART